MSALVAAILISIVFFGLRLDVAQMVGLGDLEALYVAYGLHPQPAYLDHPGLIGWIARSIGPESTPRAFHVFTALGSSLLPWTGVLAARAWGASNAAALRAYFPLALIPELSIGWFAFTPNLPFAFFWLLTLSCAGWALRLPPAKLGALLACIGVGASAALTCLSKTSGWLLAFSLLCFYVGRSQTPRWRSLGPWAALGLFTILTAPLVASWLTGELGVQFELQPGWRRVMTTLGRPIFAVTPPFLYAGVLLARDLLGPERRSPLDRLLRFSLLVPLLPAALLGAYTTGEAEWLTPAFLTLSVHAARMPPLRAAINRSCIGFGVSLALLGWCWLRTDLPLFTGELLGGYEASQDPSNDLYAWGPGRRLLEEAVRAARERTSQTPIVVGPHWAVCAQAEVALGGLVQVGCDSAELDDYDRWSALVAGSAAQTILFVTDNRFHDTPPESLYGRPRGALHSTSVERFGRSVRRISVSEFDRDEATAQGEGACTTRPARLMSARSSTVSGFGVVSNLSP
jgi:hypothetical protein